MQAPGAIPVLGGEHLNLVLQDYTMAQYRPETFEVLAHTETVKKLVTKLGYPKVVGHCACALWHVMEFLLVQQRQVMLLA